jgi:DNA replication protein DnaC
VPTSHPASRSSRATQYLVEADAKLLFFSAADLVRMLEVAKHQGRYRQAMHRAVNAGRPLIIDEIAYLPDEPRAGQPVLSGRFPRSDH